MEPADLRKRHDLATSDRLHGPSVGRILVERQVTSGAMIMVQVGYRDPPKMAFVQDDDRVETVAPASASRAAAQPVTRSTYGVGRGERGALSTSVIPMPAKRSRAAFP